MAQEGKGMWDGTAIIATNKTFKDALSAAPVSYAKHWPILLADNGVSINQDVRKALTDCEITKVIIVGGKVAVTENVEKQINEIGITDIERWSGDTGTKTSATIARKAIALGMSPNNMGVATSQSYPDALAGAALCGKNNAVLVLADDKDTTNRTFPSAYRASIKRVFVFGGELAVGKTTWCWLVCSAA
jgi:lactocepin